MGSKTGMGNFTQSPYKPWRKRNTHFAAPQSASKMMTLDVAKEIFLTLTGHLYNNNYFGLQTENPSNKLEITTPTQLLQLIDTEQDDDAAYFDGKDMKVKILKDAYQILCSSKSK
jgi:hypothetical protein